MISLLKRSLTARTVVATVSLSALALVTLGGFLSFSLANGFYQNRLDQVLSETERAVSSVCRLVSSVTDAAATVPWTLLTARAVSLRTWASRF